MKPIEEKYCPIPFWSWNEQLNVEETREQIRAMKRAGLGGFFMHARGGLQTEYMGEEWFANVEAALEEAKRCDMRVWAYDENGWPSGFGNGVVNGKGVSYQQKYLRMEEELLHEKEHIAKCGEHYFYYEANPFYVDTLDKKVVAEFIKYSYEPYYKKFKNRIEGFFTDEPQISRNGIPWSFVFEEEYEKRYQENLLEHLEELFLPKGKYKDTRIKFWKMVTDLFSKNYMKQIYDWCSERGLKLTGHLLLEESLESQLITNGACMPHYEYFHIPGVDWLGRNMRDCLTALQVSSVAEQLGKEAVLTESFAMCGHNISFAELKGLCEWQMVRGVNLLCQHLEGYSLRGIRKRDYPPAMYIQQPWWSQYHKFNEAIARIGKMLREGKSEVNVLLLHPQTTAWALYDGGDSSQISELTQQFLKTIQALEEKHILFHLGDETILERHGVVRDAKLVVGEQAYSYVIRSDCHILMEQTEKLLKEFEEAGGKIVTEVELPENDVIDNANITYTKRSGKGYVMHYFVNSSANRAIAIVKVKGKKLNIFTGEKEIFTGLHEFEPWGSLILIEEQVNVVRPTGVYHLVENSLNSMTLDYCDYYFDGELQEKHGYVLNICERANELERPVQIRQDYQVHVRDIPRQLFLVCETPEKFEIKINGCQVTEKEKGYFLDKSFKKIDITKYVRKGDNVIQFQCEFTQSERFYDDLKKAHLFEGERNKLAYDFEIEAIYLVGDFSVATEGTWTELERNAARFTGKFVIEKPRERIQAQNIEQQGFPFFCGEMVLEGEIDIPEQNPVLQIDWKGINALKVEINGIEKVMLTDNQLSLADFGVSGKTKVRFTLINNLRNLLGPHHHQEGEVLAVRPRDFYQERCVWKKKELDKWNDAYCFVNVGI